LSSITLEEDPELDEPTLTHPKLYPTQALDYLFNRRFGDLMLDYRGMVRVEESASYYSPVGKGQLFFNGTQLFYDSEFLATAPPDTAATSTPTAMSSTPEKFSTINGSAKVPSTTS
jgi:hypothetical protein